MSTESENSYILESYIEIETLIETKKAQLLKLYLNTLESFFTKFFSTKPLNYFISDIIDLPMPNNLDSYNFLRFITNVDFTKISESLSKTFEPFNIQIKWMSYTYLSSRGQKIVGTVNFTQDDQTYPITYLHVLNKEVRKNNKFIEDTSKKIFIDHHSKMIDSLNKHFNSKNFPKCLDKTEFFSSEFKYDAENFGIYNLSNKDVTKKISSFVNEKVTNNFKIYFPRLYTNLDISINTESEFNGGFLAGNNFVIKIKLMSHYNIKKNAEILSSIEEN